MLISKKAINLFSLMNPLLIFLALPSFLKTPLFSVSLLAYAIFLFLFIDLFYFLASTVYLSILIILLFQFSVS
jgi:hypothetical protein